MPDREGVAVYFVPRRGVSGSFLVPQAEWVVLVAVLPMLHIKAGAE